MRVTTARRRGLIAAAAALIGACTDRGDEPSVGDSIAPTAGLPHVNGAVLDAPSPGRRAVPAATARRRSAAGAPSSGSAPVAAQAAAPIAGGGAADDALEAGAASEEGRAAPRSAAVASTPDELSALAASLVVPVAGVTPAELRGSFTAPRGGGTRQHNALDIPAPRGTPVISATPGRVLRLYNSKAGGLMVYAADATGRFILMYGHLDRYAEGLREGMSLARGQTIGYVGTTGNAPPDVPHLHFAIARTSDVRRWWTGTPVDPAPLLKR